MENGVVGVWPYQVPEIHYQYPLWWTLPIQLEPLDPDPEQRAIKRGCEFREALHGLDEEARKRVVDYVARRHGDK